jgi:GNAT superfamily N-acetyltransferase
LQAAEKEARNRGCGLIVLSSYSFQAPSFYLKHGFEVAGQVNDCPPGYTNYYLKKGLPPGS